MTRFTPARPWRAGLLLVAALAAAASLLVTPAVGAPSPVACDNRTNNTYDKLLECVTPGRRSRTPGRTPGDRKREWRHARRRDSGV